MSVFKQLVERRVPQIVGLYVGGTWMAIEIGDWLIDKFGLPEAITAYIFIGLAALLPTVALLAWGHGAPGKDRWSTSEKVFVPVNLIAVAAALVFLDPGGAQKAPRVTMADAVQTRTVMDETGAETQFEVPVEAFHKNLTVFFFDNKTGDAAYDWLSYGLPLLISYDLDHETPLVTVSTPFSDTLRGALRTRGFEAAIGEPRSLQVTIAKSLRSDAMISGAIEMEGDVPVARLELVDLQSGEVLGDINIDLAQSLLDNADRISLRTQQALDLDPRSDEENDPLTDNFSANLKAVRQYIDARMAVELRNDYPAGIEALTQATRLDPTFAQAHSALATLHYLSGNAAPAVESIKQALAHDYKLSTPRRFLARAQRYIYANEYARGVKVLKMWTQVDQLNPESFELLGKVLMLTGQEPDQAMAALRQAQALNPGNHKLFSLMANVEQSRGNFAAAAEHIQTYIAARPEDEQAHLQLAAIYTAAEDFDNAREAYLNAELIATDDLGATLGLAKLAMHSGDFEQARERIERLLARTLTAQQQVQVLNAQAELQHMRGQMDRMLVTLASLDEIGAQFMPPILRAVQFGMNMVNAKSLRGDLDGALETVATLRTQMDDTMQGFFHMPLMSLYWEQGDRPKAIDALENAEAFAQQRADPGYAAIIAYGRVFRATTENDADSAIEQTNIAIELLDKSFLMTQENSVFPLELRVDMARLLREVGALDTARDILERTLRSSPGLASAHLEMAQIWHDLEQPEAARESLDRALATWASADENYIRLAEAETLIAALGD